VAKVIITITDDDTGASVEAVVEKHETESVTRTLAEQIGYEIMEMASAQADEVYQDGELVKKNNEGGYDGKH
jgi:hypothetical protein